MLNREAPLRVLVPSLPFLYPFTSLSLSGSAKTANHFPVIARPFIFVRPSMREDKERKQTHRKVLPATPERLLRDGCVNTGGGLDHLALSG